MSPTVSLHYHNNDTNFWLHYYSTIALDFSSFGFHTILSKEIIILCVIIIIVIIILHASFFINFCKLNHHLCTSSFTNFVYQQCVN